MVDRIGLTSKEAFRERSPDQILRDIAVNRDEISKTVARIGTRLTELLDWRIQVARHPYVAVAAAAGVGFWMSGLLQPRSTPARRAWEMVSHTLVEVAEGVRSATNAGSADHGVPTPLKTLLGTAVVRAGMEFLYQRVNDALQAGQGPNHDPQGPRSNGSSA